MGLHHCEMPDSYRDLLGPAKGGGATNDIRHRFGYGGAIDGCQEYEDGTLWVANGEYGSPINYCPICGFKARVPSVPSVPT